MYEQLFVLLTKKEREIVLAVVTIMLMSLCNPYFGKTLRQKGKTDLY